MNRLDQMDKQIQTMSRRVYKGDKSAVLDTSASSAAASPNAAAFETRMSQIEDQQRALTGQIEKLNFELQQTKDALARLQADNNNAAPAAPLAAPKPQAAAPAKPDADAPVTLTPPGDTAPGPSAGNNGPAEQLYEKAFADIREARYDEAERGFSKFIETYPNHPLTANAQYWLGETYYVRGDYKSAAKQFAQGYQSAPKSAKAPDSLLKLGLSLSKLGKKEDACLSLRQLEKEVTDKVNPLRRRAGQEIEQLSCP